MKILTVAFMLLFDNQSVGSSAQMLNKWLGPGNRTFLEVDSVVVSWWIVAFLSSVN